MLTIVYVNCWEEPHIVSIIRTVAYLFWTASLHDQRAANRSVQRDKCDSVLTRCSQSLFSWHSS